MSGRWWSKFCTEDEYIDEFATDVFGGFLQGARTTEVVLTGIRVEGRRPEKREVKKVMMAINGFFGGVRSVNCQRTVDAGKGFAGVSRPMGREDE